MFSIVSRLIVAGQCPAKFEIHSANSCSRIKIAKKIVGLQSSVICNLSGINALIQGGITLEIQRAAFYHIFSTCWGLFNAALKVDSSTTLINSQVLSVCRGKPILGYSK